MFWRVPKTISKIRDGGSIFPEGVEEVPAEDGIASKLIVSYIKRGEC